MPISDIQAAQVLARCARHCCICRQFTPLLIQVHHIVPKEDGGKDSLDNLIPICISCHAYTHAKPTMTRKFTSRELRACRDGVYELVKTGKLPAKIPLTSGELQSISSSLADQIRRDNVKYSALPPEAIELLVAAISEDAPIEIVRSGKSERLVVGNQNFFPYPLGGSSQYPPEVIALIEAGLVTSHGDRLSVTESGRARVIEIAKTTANFTIKKIKCLQCQLHFMICTWEGDRHNASNIFCPECGQHQGHFIIWVQKQLGFIFQQVPGRAAVYDFKLPHMTSRATGNEDC